MGTTELIGYLASALIVASLAMTSVVKLRVISFIGSVVYVAYGVMIHSWPIVLTNAIIAGLNVWNLRRELGRPRDLGAVTINPDAPFLADFIASHRQDIARIQPTFSGVPVDATALLLIRDGLPAGAVIGQREGDEFHLVLDYVMAPYRDSRLGQWLYQGDGQKVLHDLGVRRVLADQAPDFHRSYLERVGFVPDGQGRWAKELD